MDRNKILDDIEEIFEICQDRNIGSNETELDIKETITYYIVKKLTLTDVVKPFYCQTKRCDKTKNNQCDECALKELNDMQ